MALTNLNPFNKLTCDDSALTSLIVNGSSFLIVNGANTLFNMSLADLFIPVTAYAYQEFNLLKDTSIQIDPANIGNANGEVTTMIIQVIYPQYDAGDTLVESVDMYINFTYPLNGQIMNVGKLMVLSGSSKSGSGWDLISSPGGFLMTNPHTNFDVKVKILLIN